MTFGRAQNAAQRQPGVESAAGPGESGVGSAPDSWANGGVIFLAVLGVYFGLQVLMRTLLSTSLQSDEAEMVVLTQDWRWGYGSQPPLYNWLQKGLFAALGLNVLALSLFKNFLLWSIYLFVYLAAREIFGRVRPAVLAAAALLLLPQIAWESQRDQTHLVLATACAAATLFVFLRLLKTGRRSHFLVFGALAGVGLLSKYNFLLLPAALVASAMTFGATRAVVLRPRALLAGLAFVLITAPHVWWLLHHGDLALAESYKFKILPGHEGGAYVQGLLRFGGAVLAFLAVPAVLYGSLCRGPRPIHPRGTVGDAEGAVLKLLERSLVLGVFTALLLVLGFRVTHVRDRWLQPLLFALPIVLVGRMRAPSERVGGRLLLTLAGLAATFVSLALSGTVLTANLLHRPHNLNIPYRALAAELRGAGFQQGSLIADSAFLGGNLKMQFQSSRVIVPDIPFDEPLPKGPRLMVWSANSGQDAPPGFLEFAARLCHLAPAELPRQYREVPSDNGPKRSERLGFVWVKSP